MKGIFRADIDGETVPWFTLQHGLVFFRNLDTYATWLSIWRHLWLLYSMIMSYSSWDCHLLQAAKGYPWINPFAFTFPFCTLMNSPSLHYHIIVPAFMPIIFPFPFCTCFSLQHCLAKDNVSLPISSFMNSHFIFFLKEVYE